MFIYVYMHNSVCKENVIGQGILESDNFEKEGLSESLVETEKERWVSLDNVIMKCSNESLIQATIQR